MLKIWLDEMLLACGAAFGRHQSWRFAGAGPGFVGASSSRTARRRPAAAVAEREPGRRACAIDDAARCIGDDADDIDASRESGSTLSSFAVFRPRP